MVRVRVRVRVPRNTPEKHSFGPRGLDGLTEGACYQDQLGLGVRAHGPDRQRGVRRVVETSG